MPWRNSGAVVAVVLSVALGCAQNNDQCQRRIDELEGRLVGRIKDTEAHLMGIMSFMNPQYAAPALAQAERQLRDAAALYEEVAQEEPVGSPRHAAWTKHATVLRQRATEGPGITPEQREEYVRIAKGELAAAEKLAQPTARYEVHFMFNKDDLTPKGLTKDGVASLAELRRKVDGDCHHLRRILVIGYACDKDDSEGKQGSVSRTKTRAYNTREEIQRVLSANRTCPAVAVKSVNGAVIARPEIAGATDEELEPIRAPHRVATVFLFGLKTATSSQ